MTAHESDIPDLCERLAQSLAKQIVSRTMEIVAEKLATEISPIPEPAEGNDPDYNATGGVLIPSMVAEQSGESEAGETITASASAVLPPVYLAPGDPASVEGGSMGAYWPDCRHAPPATKFQSALEPERVAETATAPDLSDPPVAVAVNNSISASAETCGGGHMREPVNIAVNIPVEVARHRGLGIGEDTFPTDDWNAGVAPGPQEPIDLPNPLTPMDRLETSTVQPDSGTVLDSEHDDARPEQAPSSQGRASFSFYDPGPIPECLRRKPKVAA